MSDIKQRTVYLLKRTDKSYDDGKDLYVGSTSRSLKERLLEHRSRTRVSTCKLHTRMQEVGIYNWEIITLSEYICNEEEIRGYEKSWIELLNSDLNKNLPIRENNEKNRERARKHYFKSLEEKRYHCDVCEKAFGCSENLKRHFNTLKHSYAYLNSLD